MMISINKALSAAVLRLLRPLVRLLLKSGVSYGTFADLVKWVFVDVAAREFSVNQQKQTDTRIATLTGLNRKEVARLKKIDVPSDEMTEKQYNRAARVIRGWSNDHRFTDHKGEPLALKFENDDNSFSELVKAYSGDITARTILDELLRVGAVEQDADDKFQLVTNAYIPAKCDDSKLHILGTDVASLIATIDHNLNNEHEEAYFQRKVEYNNLPIEALPKLKKLTQKNAQALLEQLNDYLATQDRDANPNSQGSGQKRAGVAIYYFEEDLSKEK